jgi:molybdopterin biosynthesis enzyme
VADKSTMPHQIEPHHDRQTFIARGIASGEAARKSGTYISADAVLRKLSKRLGQARKGRLKQRAPQK